MWTGVLCGAPRCAQHPRPSLVSQSLIAQLVRSRYVSKTSMKDNPIKKSLSKSNQRSCNIGCFPVEWEIKNCLHSILSSCWGAAVVGWLPSGEPSGFRGLVVCPLFQIKDYARCWGDISLGQAPGKPWVFRGLGCPLC